MTATRSLLLLLCLCCSLTLAARPVWMPDATLTSNGKASLQVYELLSKGKALLVAMGNIHTDAAHELLEARCLQKMAREYGSDHQNAFASDVQVLFLNIRPESDNAPLPDGCSFPVADLPEAAGLQEQEGWQEWYQPNEVSVFVLLPDHLAYPLSGRHADDWYDQIRALRMRVAPAAAPDVRLLQAAIATSPRGTAVEVSLQNYSSLPLQQATLEVFCNGRKIGGTTWEGDLPALQTASLAVTVDPSLATSELEVVVATPGDADPTNNRWTLTGNDPVATVVPEVRLTTGLMKIDFAHKLPGQIDTLQLGTLQHATGNPQWLHLKWAHAPSSPFDRSSIALLYSIDNGATWQQLQLLEGATLATAPQQSYTYIPKPEDWRRLQLALPQTADGTVLQLAVAATADFTNDAYLADVTITGGADATALR